MAAPVIIDMPDTTTTAVNKKLDELREKVGAVTMGRVLTLIVAPDSDAILEESLEAANNASHEHPSRIIVTMRGPVCRRAAPGRAAARRWRHRSDRGGDPEPVRAARRARRQRRDPVPAARHPRGGVVARRRPAIPAQDPLGKLAIRRITDATNGTDPLSAIKSRRSGYTAGDTDLAWARITYWRALLTSAVDLPPHEPIESALVSGLKAEPALDILAGWLASRIDGPVRRAVGELKVELVRKSETIVLSRPQQGRTATLSRTAKPEALLPLARRGNRRVSRRGPAAARPR